MWKYLVDCEGQCLPAVSARPVPGSPLAPQGIEKGGDGSEVPPAR